MRAKGWFLFIISSLKRRTQTNVRRNVQAGCATVATNVGSMTNTSPQPINFRRQQSLLMTSQRQLYFPPNDNYTSLFLMVNYCHGEGLLLLPPAPLGGRAPIIGCHHLLFSISEPLRSPLLDFIG